MWTLEGDRASLTLTGFTGCVNVRHPERGLHAVTVGDALNGFGCLRVQTPGRVLNDTGNAVGEAIAECYARGDDLVVTYDQTPSRTVRPQVYWSAYSGNNAVGVELLLSMQTSLLDSTPAIQISAGLPASAAFSLDAALALNVATGATAPVENQSDAAVLWRLPDTNVTYAQLTHPSDARTGKLCITLSHDGKEMELVQSLFDEFLEKGVIRRARMLGVFLDSDNDAAVAQQVFQEWVAAPPRLTT